MSQPERATALFPKAIAPQRGEVSERAYRRGYIPKTYTQSIIDGAKEVMRHWNETFRGVEGSYRVNVNDACNTKAWKRFCDACERSEGEFRFGVAEVCRAITRYRGNASNRQLRAWKRFSDWLDVENVDRHLGAERVDQHAVDQRAQEKELAARRKAFALMLIRHRGMVGAAERAKQNGSTLDAMCRAMKRNPQASEKDLRWCQKTHGLIATLGAMTADCQAKYEARAEQAHQIAYGRPSGSHPLGKARIEALTLALLDIDIANNEARAKAAAKTGGAQ